MDSKESYGNPEYELLISVITLSREGFGGVEIKSVSARVRWGVNGAFLVKRIVD